MELCKYNPTEIESKWYQYWLTMVFSSKPDGRAIHCRHSAAKRDGALHGHAFNNTIQDVLARARMQGKMPAGCPGTDHASIATEAKVVKNWHRKVIKN